MINSSQFCKIQSLPFPGFQKMRKVARTSTKIGKINHCNIGNARLITAAVVSLLKRASYRTHDPMDHIAKQSRLSRLYAARRRVERPSCILYIRAWHIHIHCLEDASWRRLQLGIIGSFMCSHRLHICIFHSNADSARLVMCVSLLAGE